MSTFVKRLAKRQGAASRLKLALLLLFGTVGVGCENTGPRTIDLMPAPAVFAGGKIDPLSKGPPPLPYDDFGLLYATDRKASEDPGTRPFYLNEEGFIVRMGAARVQAAGPELSWEEARRISLSKERRRGDYQLKIRSVEESSILDSTYTLLARQPESSATTDRTGEAFAARVDARLAQSGTKDIYIYVHGYRVIFDDPVLIAAELWHFLGYRGAFIAYAWPSTPRTLAYLSDLETASTMARKLRLFLAYLSEKTQVDNIHIIAYSAGSRLVVQALEQLALLHTADSDEEVRNKLRIGNVVFVGSDISRDAFGAGMMDGLTRIPKRTVVYVSSNDTALAWARFIFRRGRMGEMWDETLAPRTRAFLEQHPSLEFIDVTEAAGSSTGNGHAYFRKSPWVSSDILTLLAFDLDPAQRGLERDEHRLVWRFPPGYIERLQESLLALNPELAGAGAEADE